MASEHNAKTRVYANAFLCESVIRDRADILTAVRITNAYALNPAKYTPFLPDGTPDERNEQSFYLPFTVGLVVIFYSEQPTDFDVMLSLVPPEGQGQKLSPTPIRCHLTVPGAGHTLNIRGTITTQVEGIFWFEVYVDGQLVTKSPLVVKLNPPEPAGQGRPELELSPDEKQLSGSAEKATESES